MRFLQNAHISFKLIFGSHGMDLATWFDRSCAWILDCGKLVVL
jgi:hypothetical protein